MQSNASPRYHWHVVKVSEDRLGDTLNNLERDWEIFTIVPTINFGSKFMGAPVPSEVLYTVIARQSRY
jgi:hypothetical protein